MTHPPADTTLEALYTLNKHARKYAELGTENYREGKKTTAKANSHKKEALYAVKEEVLTAIHESADRVERHDIDGRPYYCLYFDHWSFHTPVDRLGIDEDRIDDHVTLDDFEKNPEKEHSDRSLKASLTHIETAFGVNANEYLPEQYLWWGHNRHFIGWPYLGDE